MGAARHTVKSLHAELVDTNSVLTSRIEQLTERVDELYDMLSAATAQRMADKAQPRQTTMPQPTQDDERNPPPSIYDEQPAANSGGNSTDSPVAFFRRCRNTYGIFVNAKLSDGNVEDDELLSIFGFEGGKVTRHLDRQSNVWANIYPANPNGGAA